MALTIANSTSAYDGRRRAFGGTTVTQANTLGITSEVELAREEELLTKQRALELFEGGLLGTFEVGTFAGLAKIHGYLFQDV